MSGFYNSFYDDGRGRGEQEAADRRYKMLVEVNADINRASDKYRYQENEESRQKGRAELERYCRLNMNNADFEREFSDERWLSNADQQKKVVDMIGADMRENLRAGRKDPRSLAEKQADAKIDIMAKEYAINNIVDRRLSPPERAAERKPMPRPIMPTIQRGAGHVEDKKPINEATATQFQKVTLGEKLDLKTKMAIDIQVGREFKVDPSSKLSKDQQLQQAKIEAKFKAYMAQENAKALMAAPKAQQSPKEQPKAQAQATAQQSPAPQAQTQQAPAKSEGQDKTPAQLQSDKFREQAAKAAAEAERRRQEEKNKGHTR